MKHRFRNMSLVEKNTSPKQETTLEEVDKLIKHHEYRYSITNNIEDFKEIFYYRGRKDEFLRYQEQEKNLFSEEEVELIVLEMVNWVVDNVGNPNAQSGKHFDEVLNKFKNK